MGDGVLYKNVGEVLFTAGEMTQTQLHHQGPPPQGGQPTEARKPGVHSLQTAQPTGWRLAFPLGAPGSLNFW